MNKLTTQQVVLFLGLTAILMAGAVFLVVKNKDVGIILSIVGMVVTPILFAAGASVASGVSVKLESLKETQNGNLSQILTMLKDERDQRNALTAMAVQKIDPAKEGNGHTS
jgi:hypothetical protein